MQIMMNRQIIYLFKRLILFSLFSFVCYAILLYIFGNLLSNRNAPNLIYKPGENFLRLEEVKNTSNVDLLFLGSSHAYRGFDTRIFKKAGYHTFNLGSSSQTPIQSKLILNRYLKELNPKLVVFEVNPGTFTADGVESALDLIANDQNDLGSLKMAIGQFNTKVYNTYMYAVSKNILGYFPKIKSNTYHKGGYVSREKLTFNSNFESKENRFVLKKKQIDAFEDILQMFKKRNIDYILVQAPVTTGRFQSFTNISEFNTKMKNYGDYYNFNNQLQLNDTIDFYDAHHLNQSGVNIFNTAFLEVLEKNYTYILNDSKK